MLTLDEVTLDWLEERFTGFRRTLSFYDGAVLPWCSHCGSEDTAAVHVGVNERTKNMEAATSKFKLIARGLSHGICWCNTCERFFPRAQPPYVVKVALPQ